MLRFRTHGQWIRDTDCIYHYINSGDRIHLAKVGYDPTIKRFTYITFETEQNVRITFGKATDTTVVTPILFPYPLVGIRSASLWTRGDVTGEIEQLTFLLNTCTDADPEPLVLEYLSQRYINVKQEVEVVVPDLIENPHDYTNDWRPPPIEYPEDEEEPTEVAEVPAEKEYDPNKLVVVDSEGNEKTYNLTFDVEPKELGNFHGEDGIQVSLVGGITIIVVICVVVILICIVGCSYVRNDSP